MSSVIHSTQNILNMCIWLQSCRQTHWSCIIFKFSWWYSLRQRHYWTWIIMRKKSTFINLQIDFHDKCWKLDIILRWPLFVCIHIVERNIPNLGKVFSNRRCLAQTINILLYCVHVIKYGSLQLIIQHYSVTGSWFFSSS